MLTGSAVEFKTKPLAADDALGELVCFMVLHVLLLLHLCQHVRCETRKAEFRPHSFFERPNFHLRVFILLLQFSNRGGNLSLHFL